MAKSADDKTTDDKGDPKSAAAPETPAPVVLPPADHNAWDDLKAWVRSEIDAAVSAVRSTVGSGGRVADPSAVKSWVRKEIDLAAAGHSTEQRSTELNP